MFQCPTGTTAAAADDDDDAELVEFTGVEATFHCPAGDAAAARAGAGSDTAAAAAASSNLMSTRGRPLDEETAEEILVGHLAPREGEKSVLIPQGAPVEDWSWKVVCGVNPAYDYFSDQHQIFYRDKGRRSAM